MGILHLLKNWNQLLNNQHLRPHQQKLLYLRHLLLHQHRHKSRLPRSLLLPLLKNGATYSQSSQIRITGKIKSGYYIQVYGNYSTKDLQCLTFNSFSNGGAGQADANGNFDFSIAYEGYRSGQNTLVVAALQDSRVETCFPANNVSDVITYTYTDPIPNP